MDHTTVDLKPQVLDELIREKVLAAGLDRDPELVQRWERMVVVKYEAAHKPDAEKQYSLRNPLHVSLKTER
jgi:hypothetical protein